MKATTTPIFLLLSSFVSLTLAQNYGNPSSSSTTAASTTAASAGPSQSAVHNVAVGANGLVFTPDTITAAAGDTVLFSFAPGNFHSVVQSSFAAPCQPISGTGLYSGFAPASDVFVVTVNDTNPIWVYCGQTQGAHCQSGMVMVVNPPASGSQTLAAYKAAAQSAGTSTSPATVQGGVVEPKAAAQATSSGTGSASGSATGSASAASSQTGAAAPGMSVNWKAMAAGLFVLGLLQDKYVRIGTWVLTRGVL